MLIIGGKYGSVNEQGVSYTEAEFDYACGRGIRVIAFLAKDISSIPMGKCESVKKKKEQLIKFRKKVENNAGLIAYWTDKSDLEIKIGNSLANVLREYPSNTGWVRVDKDINLVEFLDKENDVDVKKYRKYLFPSLKSMKLEEPQINYDVNNPSKAVVVCGTSYVKLETRDGKIEKYMVDACLEFIKLVRDRNSYLSEEEIFCLRSLWFNSVNPEVIIYLDYLYEHRQMMNYSLKEVKGMFYDGEILGDGICYNTWVRCFPVCMCSDHFDQNNKEFYEIMDLSVYIKLYWEDAEFQYTDDSKSIIYTVLKISNTYQYPLKFQIEAQFELKDNDIFPAGHTLEGIIARNDKGKEYFTLDGHDTKILKVFFEKSDEDYKREKPYDIRVYVEDDTPRYE